MARSQAVAKRAVATPLVPLESYDLSKLGDLPKALAKFRAFQDPAETLEIIKGSLEQGTTEFDLLRFRVPGGGGTTFEWEEFGETQNAQKINGIMLATGLRRSWWNKGFGMAENAPPDCQSEDATFGYGVLPSDITKGMKQPPEDGDRIKGGRGFTCANCANAQFGTAKREDGSPGKGQACKTVRAIYFLKEGELVPSVLVVPSASLKNATGFLQQFMRQAIPPYSMNVRFKLEKQVGPPPYSKLVFELAGSRAESQIPAGPYLELLKSISNFVSRKMLPQFTINVGDVKAEN